MTKLSTLVLCLIKANSLRWVRPCFKEQLCFRCQEWAMLGKDFTKHCSLLATKAELLLKTWPNPSQWIDSLKLEAHSDVPNLLLFLSKEIWLQSECVEVFEVTPLEESRLLQSGKISLHRIQRAATPSNPNQLSVTIRWSEPACSHQFFCCTVSRAWPLQTQIWFPFALLHKCGTGHRGSSPRICFRILKRPKISQRVKNQQTHNDNP